MSGSCESGNEHLVFIKGREFLDYLLTSQEGLFSMELIH